MGVNVNASDEYGIMVGLDSVHPLESTKLGLFTLLLKQPPPRHENTPQSKSTERQTKSGTQWLSNSNHCMDMQ